MSNDIPEDYSTTLSKIESGDRPAAVAVAAHQLEAGVPDPVRAEVDELDFGRRHAAPAFYIAGLIDAVGVGEGPHAAAREA